MTTWEHVIEAAVLGAVALAIGIPFSWLVCKYGGAQQQTKLRYKEERDVQIQDVEKEEEKT